MGIENLNLISFVEMKTGDDILEIENSSKR